MPHFICIILMKKVLLVYLIVCFIIMQKSVCVSHQLGVNKYLIQATDWPIQEKHVSYMCDFLFEKWNMPDSKKCQIQLSRLKVVSNK